MKEKVLQDLVIRDIENSNFFEKVVRTELSSIAQGETDADFINSATHTRKLNYVYESLILNIYRETVENIFYTFEGDLEIINSTDGAIKSISMDCDRLYPDILAYNAESTHYYIFELKTSTKTEREAITELYAYEAELINHLPMLSKDSIIKIIIATDYNPTLQHAVTNSILRGDQLLCLKPVLKTKTDRSAGRDDTDRDSTGDAFVIDRYEMVDVFAWSHIKLIPASGDKRNVFDGVTICVSKSSKCKNEKDEDCNDHNTCNDYHYSEDEVIQDMREIADHLATIENNNQGNGFCILWKSHSADDEKSNSIDEIVTDYFITVFALNPYLISIIDLHDRDDILSEFISNNYHDYCWDENGDQLLINTLPRLKKAVNHKYDLYIEGFNNYAAYENGGFFHGDIFDVKTWGRFGELVQNLYLRKKEEWFSGVDWNRFKKLSLIITYLIEDYPFRVQSGAGEAFQIGLYIGAFEDLYDCLQPDDGYYDDFEGSDLDDEDEYLEQDESSINDVESQDELQEIQEQQEIKEQQEINEQQDISELTALERNYNRKTTYNIHRIWNYIFCTKAKLLSGNHKFTNNLGECKKEVNRLEEHVKSKGIDFSEALEIGKKYAAFSDALSSYDLCKVYEIESLEELILDDRDRLYKKERPPKLLSAYFLKIYDRVLNLCRHDSGIMDSAVGDIWSILFLGNPHRDLSAPKTCRDDIKKLINEGQTDIDTVEIGSEYMIEFLRKILNVMI